MPKASIFIRFTGESLHCWPEAPEHRFYLRTPHRHLFYIEARCYVDHDDRSVEFHDVRDQIEVLWGLMAGPKRDLGSMSCEMIARRIGAHLVEWNPRRWTVIVSEDDEMGACVASG